MRALILAAGRGSRLGERTQDRPKAMVELLGKPLFERALASLRQAGIDEIAVCTGYRAHAFAPYALPQFHNPDWQHSNMLASLLAAREWLQHGPVIVSYSDIFFPPQFVSALMQAIGGTVLACDPDWLALWRMRFADPLADAESFHIDGDGMLLDIGQRMHDPAQAQAQYLGLFRIDADFLEAVDRLGSAIDVEAMRRMDMTGLFSRLLQLGHRIGTVAVRGVWGEVDCDDDLQLYQRLLCEQNGELAYREVAPSAHVHTP